MNKLCPLARMLFSRLMLC